MAKKNKKVEAPVVYEQVMETAKEEPSEVAAEVESTSYAVMTDEPVDSEIPTTIIDDESAKTYKFSSDIVKLDNSYAHGVLYDYTKCLIVIKNSPLKLINDDGQVVGFCVASIQGSDAGQAVVADFFLDYSTPERLNIETGEIPMYVYPDSYSDAVELSATKRRITSMYISAIRISTSMLFPGAIQLNAKKD